MSDQMETLLRDGERGSVHDNDVAQPSMYDVVDDMFGSGSYIHSADVDTGIGSTSGDNLNSDNLNTLSTRADSESRQPSIPIPSGLAGIASQVKPLDLGLDDPLDAIAYEVIQDDRGEMGGKRKKPLAERAGWKDMDENGNMPKRPRGKRAAKEHVVDSFVGYQPSDQRGRASEGRRVAGDDSQEPDEGMTEEAANTLARDLAEAGREMGLESGALADALRQGEDSLLSGEHAHPGGGPVDDKTSKQPSTESRAEQNRRAQQVYRRRREERIKELEAQAAALEPTRRALNDSHQKMKAIALEYETAKIQLAALHATLHSLNKQGVSILTTQYNFPMDANSLKESEKMRPGPIGHSDVEKAFEQLERQSRELAGSRRAE